jgi:hypothetical protein
MAVIINDFEVVVDPAAQTPRPRGTDDSSGGQAQAQAAPQLRPEEIERIMRHFAARRARVTAD